MNEFKSCFKTIMTDMRLSTSNLKNDTCHAKICLSVYISNVNSP